jgi:anti-sigma regulatory factor (Ser/Thr protein kinase)
VTGESMERIRLEAPIAGAFQPVIRLIIGGIAERVDFGCEEIDDLQLAVERLLAEAAGAGADGSVELAFEVGAGRVRATVGPLSETAVASALQEDAPPGELTLRRILETVVDAFAVENAADGSIIVRLEKLKVSP